MLFQYAHALIGFAFGMVFVVMNVFVIVRLLSPKVDEPMKGSTYECGEPPVGDAWVRFDMRFYTMALIFIIFEVEAILLFPWAAIYSDLMENMRAADAGNTMFPFLEAAVFVLILGVGVVYAWKKGDMNWVKAMTQSRQPSGPKIAPKRADSTKEVA